MDLEKYSQLEQLSDTQLGLLSDSIYNVVQDYVIENIFIVGSFVISENVKHISVLRPKGDLEAIEMLSQKDFREHTQFLNTTFDLIFLCADNKNAISLLSALEDLKIHHISIARTRKTKWFC